MSAEERIAALEERIARLEHLRDIEPENIVADWIADTEKFAFKFLIQKLENLVPGFSATSLRREFREANLDLIEKISQTHLPHDKAGAVIADVLRARVNEVIDDLFPDETDPI